MYEYFHSAEMTQKCRKTPRLITLHWLTQHWFKKIFYRLSLRNWHPCVAFTPVVTSHQTGTSCTGSPPSDEVRRTGVARQCGPVDRPCRGGRSQCANRRWLVRIPRPAADSTCPPQYSLTPCHCYNYSILSFAMNHLKWHEWYCFT